MVEAASCGFRPSPEGQHTREVPGTNDKLLRRRPRIEAISKPCCPCVALDAERLAKREPLERDCEALARAEPVPDIPADGPLPGSLGLRCSAAGLGLPGRVSRRWCKPPPV